MADYCNLVKVKDRGIYHSDGVISNCCQENEDTTPEFPDVMRWHLFSRCRRQKGMTEFFPIKASG